MGKRERKIEAISKYISNVGGNWPAWSYGKIPKNKAQNACYEYAGAIEPKDILGLIDITVSGNGKKGMVFTESKVYFNNGFLENKGSVSYKKIHDSGVIPGEVFSVSYNTEALKELLSQLSYIEGENMQDTINDFGNAVNQGINFVSDTIDNVTDTIDKVANLFNQLSNWLDDGKNEDNN